jgi:hypothetical protein
LFGVYENFPEMYHSIARLDHEVSTEKLQRVLVESLYRLNRGNGSSNFPEFTRHNIGVELEFGIADGLTFSYLDGEILEHCREMIYRQVFSMLDFLCVVRYYVIEEAKRKALRFDYHMLRFLFNEEEVELRVYHEKGTRRLPIEDLVKFLLQDINQELVRNKSSPLKMSYMRAL